MYVHMCVHVHINTGVSRDRRALDNLELELQAFCEVLDVGTRNPTQGFCKNSRGGS